MVMRTRRLHPVENTRRAISLKMVILGMPMKETSILGITVIRSDRASGVDITCPDHRSVPEKSMMQSTHTQMQRGCIETLSRLGVPAVAASIEDQGHGQQAW
jgi:hypothetical protein